MFGYKYYVPVLKGREGEYGALQTLSAGAKGCFTPLLEVPPVMWDFVQEMPTKSIDEHLEKVIPRIERSWGILHRFFLDLLWIAENDRMINGEHPLKYLFGVARERGLLAVPVIGLLKSDEYLAACRTVLKLDQRGICLRIFREDFKEFPDVEGQILELFEKLAISPRDADLVLDLRGLTPAEQEVNVDSAITLVESIPKIREWRSFALTATSFPENLMGYPPADLSMIPRLEWGLWLDLIRRRRKLSRLPAFGDYAISHPQPSEVDPRIMRPSASIRYTVDSAWLVSKGKNLRDHGYEQFFAVCRNLIRQKEYSGSEFSWGDKYIYDCAYERASTGNLTTWRKVGTSHHLAFVLRQLANEFGS